MVTVSPKAENCKLNVVCDALILDDESQTDTYPTMEVANASARCEHEASVSKVSDDQVFYLMSRGHSEEEALAMMSMVSLSHLLASSHGICRRTEQTNGPRNGR